MILDSTFVIDILRNDSVALAKANELEKNRIPQFITIITIFELFSGIARSGRTEEEREKVVKILHNQAVLPLTEDVAEKAGEIHGELIKTGKKLDSHDCMIAGTALIKNELVLTRNVKDFSRILGLKIETY